LSVWGGSPGPPPSHYWHDCHSHLADIDANDQVSGNHAFKFIGQGQFTGAGQARFFQRNGDMIIQADTSTAIAGAEPVIVLDGLVSLNGTDFIL
jgi:hypothetical protein